MDDVEAERAKLVDAAWGVLERTGFEGFKVSSVIRATGSSMRTFYRCFASKDALFVELLIDESHRGAARIERLVAEHTDPIDRITAWIAAFMSTATAPTLVARTRLFTAIGERFVDRPEVFTSTSGLLLPPLVDAIDAGAQAGSLRTAGATADASMILALCRAELVDLVQGRTTKDPAVQLQRVTEFVLRALQVTT